jgi:L-ascorbate metabolism protein UlaG (beta-lactamase superfamily)
MEIYWLGHGCFRLRGRDATVVTNPCPPTTGYRIGRLTADIVTVSRDHPDSNYRQAFTNEPKFIMGPGEYEIAGVLISAVRTDHNAAEERAARNVAYMLDLDDIRICHLGDISQVPSADDAEALSAADVLLIPVGGGPYLDAEKAAETVSLLEPKVVIPMIYKTEAATAPLDAVDRFLKEMGTEAKPPESRLNLTRSGVPADTTVVLLNYRGA